MKSRQVDRKRESPYELSGASSRGRSFFQRFPWLRPAYLMETQGLLILTILLIVVFSIVLADTFPTQSTMRAILTSSSTTATLALGETIVVAAGQYDLSIGYLLDIGAVLTIGFQVNNHLAWGLVIVMILVFCTLVGLINGLLVQVAKIESFIATLGVGTICYGVAEWYTGGKQLTGNLPSAFLAYSQAGPLGIPLPAFYVLGLTILLWIVLEFLPIGRYLYAAGSNRRAAELVGIPVGRYTIAAFMASGFLTGVAAVVLASQLGLGQSSVGQEFLLPAFVGALLGATTIRPGRVNAWGTIIAVLILAVGIAGLEQLGAAFFVDPLFQGGTLVVAVGLAGYVARRRRAAQAREEVEAASRGFEATSQQEGTTRAE